MCYMIHPHANTVLGHLAPTGKAGNMKAQEN